MKTSIAVATATLLLAGCSSSAPLFGEDPIVSELTGKSADYAQSRLGLPNRRSESRSGAMMWVYVDRQKGMTARECEVTLNIRNGKIENVLVSTQNQSLLSSMTSSCDNIRNSLVAQR